MSIRFFIISILFSWSTWGQYDNGTIDFGLGGVISIGLQEEIGFDARVQYTTLLEKYSYLLEYNRYFISETENTEVLNEFGVDFLVRLFTYDLFKLEGGIGYIVNDYRLLKSARDTSNLFINSGRYNHGLQLKFRGQYQLNIPIHVFLEINFKSYGKRYDTIALGLTYSIGI